MCLLCFGSSHTLVCSGLCHWREECYDQYLWHTIWPGHYQILPIKYFITISILQLMFHLVKCVFTPYICFNVAISFKMEAWHPHKHLKHWDIVLFYLDLKHSDWTNFNVHQISFLKCLLPSCHKPDLGLLLWLSKSQLLDNLESARWKFYFLSL